MPCAGAAMVSMKACGRVEQVREQGDVPVGARLRGPGAEIRYGPGVRRVLAGVGEGVQDAAPGGERVDGAALQAARRASRRWRVVSSAAPASVSSRSRKWSRKCHERHAQRSKARESMPAAGRISGSIGCRSISKGMPFSVRLPWRGRGPGRAGRGGRFRPGCCRMSSSGSRRVENIGAGRAFAGDQRGLQFRRHALVVGDQMSSSRSLSPRARERVPSAPSSQRRSSAIAVPDNSTAKGAVGGVENMVAFVEHVARRHVIIVQPAPDGLGHHQRVVGDDEIGLAGIADTCSMTQQP